MRFLRRRATVVLAFLLIAGVLLALNPHWYLTPIGAWLALPADTLATDTREEAVVVLGGGGQQRLLHGIALYHENAIPEIWYTGNMILEEGRSFIDPLYARTYAMERGVPEEAVKLLQSTSTWEDAAAVRQMVEQEGVSRLVIVTNYFHSRRAMCVLRHQLANHNVTLTYSPPLSDRYDANTWWQSEQSLVDVSEEWIKVLYYWAKYGLVPWTC